MELFFQTDTITIASIACRLVISFILSTIIGIEREIHRQPAGLRTHILICLGATVLMVLSLYIPQWSGGKYDADPGRIAAQIVTGIGFLGAGAILKIGLNVKGLTTAANVWVVAAIGMTVGMGLYIAAGIVTGITLMVLVVLNKVEHRFITTETFKALTVEFNSDANQINPVLHIVQEYKFNISNMDVYESEKKNVTVLRLLVKVPGKWDIGKLFADIRSLDGIMKIKLDEHYE